METSVKNNLSDITYMSKRSPILTRKRGGLIRTYNLRSLCSVSYVLIKWLAY